MLLIIYSFFLLIIKCVFMLFFFFSSRRRHTRSYGDWSSDVCSSDLFHGADLLWVAGVWIAYFLTNLALVAAALAWTDSFRGVFLDDFWHYTGMTFSVLALSPLIVVVAQNAWLLLPLLLIPLLLVHKMAQMSLENEHQAIHDSLTGLPNR